ncbi:MAG: DUF975 family protein [Firmicutes bacterium]|nr:DUF975 family protein [Bacillota bacterium]
MWSRKELKIRAKGVLKRNYWKAFLVSLIIAFVGGNKYGGSFNFRFAKDDIPNFMFGHNGDFFFEFLFVLIPIISIIIVGGICLRIFLGYPLEVGGRCFFLRSAEGDINLDYIGYAFKKGRYINIIKGMFYKGVLVFLWTLLLIIPGIVKSYAYRMVPYLLSNNPYLGYKRAVELSNEMTNGEKLDMFILDLSFLGWYLLGALALGIGVLFVMPYENATKAELYLYLQKKALDNGLCSYEELNMNKN